MIMSLEHFQKEVIAYFRQPLMPIASKLGNSFLTMICLALFELRIALMQLGLKFSKAIPSCAVSDVSSLFT